MNPISVIIPLFNKEKSIRTTIQSVLQQTFSNFEIIIVDDGSTDNSSAIVHSIKDKRIKYYYKSNTGVSSTRNFGIKVANGQNILFLDADDYLLKNCLETLLTIKHNNMCDIVTSNFLCLYPDKNESLYAEKYSTGKVVNPYKSMFFNRLLITSGNTLFSRDVLLRCSYNESITRYEDLELSMRLCAFCSIYSTNIPTFKYRLMYNELSKPCKDTSKDFLFSLDFKSYNIWGRVLLGKVLYEGISWTYPHEKEKLLNQYKEYICYYQIYKSYNLLFRIIKKIKKTLWK